MRLWTMLAIVMWAGVALAQNSFPTPGGQTVRGIVVMCITAGKAVPCTGTAPPGPDNEFPTPGGATVGGGVSMCIVGGLAVPCAGGGGGGPTAVIPTANDVSANWQKSGLAVIGGIPTRATQCGATVTASGLTPPQAGDDATKLNAAIAACPAGQVVQMGAGTFNYALSQLPMVVNKGITIRGSGTDVGTCNAATGTPCWPTVLQTYDGPQPKYASPAQCGVTIGTTTNCPNTSGFFMLAPNGPFDFGWGGCNPFIIDPTASNCGSPLAVDAAQGATTVRVAQTSNFSVNMWVLIDEYPAMVTTTNPVPGQASILASPEFLTASASPAVMRLANPDGGNNMAACTSGGNAGYSFCVNRLNQEIHKVTAIGAGPCPGVNCTLTFDSPLTLAFRQSGSHDARVYWPQKQNGVTANPFVEQVGIENLTITRATGGTINIEFCAYCWVKNVEINYWIAGAVNFTWAARSQVTGSYLHNCIDCQNNGNEYPIGISVASSENLVDNSIITFGGKGMVGRAAPSSVVAYSYIDKTFYMTNTGIGNYWNDMGLNGTHFGGAHSWLMEGNWASNCDGDETHGNAVYHVFFRNQCNGGRTTFVDPSSSQTVNDCAGIGFADPGNTPNPPGPLRAGGPMAQNYWYGFVANVMGFAGMQSCAGGAYIYGANSAGATSNRTIWHTGWTGGEWGTIPDANLISGTPFIFRNGNFDYVNAAVVDNAVGFSQTFANSLYLSAAPAYFGPGAACSYPWPWIIPTSSPPVRPATGPGGCSTTSGLPAKARFDAGTPFRQP